MTERPTDMDQLRDAHTRLERILESTGAGTWEHDVQTGETRVDERWAEIVGYTLEELGGTGAGAWRRLAHPDDLRQADDLSRRHQAGELPIYECAVRMRHKDGHWVWVQVRGRVLARTADGRPLMMFGTHVDITEQQKAVDDLRSAHARLRAFVDSNIVGVIVAQADGSIVETNDYYLDLIGYTRDEFERGEVNWRTITPPEWLAADETALKELAERGMCTPYEKEYLARDGRRVAVYLSDAMLPGGEIVACVLDITERKVAEVALRESEERFRAMVEEAPVGVALTDLSTGRFLEVNDRYAAIVGLTREAMTTVGWEAITHPDDLGPDLQSLARVRSGEIPGYRMEKRYRRTDRSIVWVDMSVTALRAGNPERPLVLTIVEDITAHRAAEQALRQSRSELEEAQRLAHVGSWTWVAATDENAWSDELFRIFGLEPGRPTPTTVEEPDLYDAASYERLEQAYARTSRTGTPFEVEYDIVRPDGTVRHLVEQGEAVRNVARVLTGLRGSVTDITERKAAEAEILALNADLERRVTERTASLEAAVKELETFNYSASHDLRAPLRAINGYASLLERHQGAALDAESRRYLGLIETASERMGILIEELLDYSRLGRDGVRAEPVPLEPLVARLHAVYGERLAAAGGRLELAGSAAVPRADPHLLERILDNLVGNALTYRRLDVPPLVTIAAERHGNRVTISVTDNGIGIPPEHREQIFALFTRLHREDEYPGTGIGLSIVRKAARLMGTDVAVTSVEGEGSTFSLVLPAAG